MTRQEQRRAGLVVEREHADGCQERPTFTGAESRDWLGRRRTRTYLWLRFSCPMCGASFLFREVPLLGDAFIDHGRGSRGRPS